jgi:hypothetical protein
MELGQSLGHKYSGERFKERDCVVKIPDWKSRKGFSNLHRSFAATKPNIAPDQSNTPFARRLTQKRKKKKLNHRPRRMLHPGMVRHNCLSVQHC